jgi:predicted ABC-type ATPase
LGSSNLYIIAGCNGAGKTSASIEILPEMLSCNEFVNADEIALQLSTAESEGSAIQAGKIMLKRIEELLISKKDFAIETTLASRSIRNIIHRAYQKGYIVNLIFYWLDSPELAKERVRSRVQLGGHDIPSDVIVRRYYAGLRNLFNLYIPIVDYWMIFNNSESPAKLIAEGYGDRDIEIKISSIFTKLIELFKDGQIT